MEVPENVREIALHYKEANENVRLATLHKELGGAATKDRLIDLHLVEFEHGSQHVTDGDPGGYNDGRLFPRENARGGHLPDAPNLKKLHLHLERDGVTLMGEIYPDDVFKLYPKLEDVTFCHVKVLKIKSSVPISLCSVHLEKCSVESLPKALVQSNVTELHVDGNSNAPLYAAIAACNKKNPPGIREHTWDVHFSIVAGSEDASEIFKRTVEPCLVYEEIFRCTINVPWEEANIFPWASQAFGRNSSLTRTLTCFTVPVSILLTLMTERRIFPILASLNVIYQHNAAQMEAIVSQSNNPYEFAPNLESVTFAYDSMFGDLQGASKRPTLMIMILNGKPRELPGGIVFKISNPAEEQRFKCSESHPLREELQLYAPNIRFEVQTATQ
ncbi:hypothetical protein AURDEDRAFT_125926 [Auricularia subglabra TFB-10046 SS5]|nr:hypothetical protein AURDEDRAFT_125926 [Auricularia subglabra TFB-10046 SS5]